MKNNSPAFKNEIEAFLTFRESLGYKRKTYEGSLYSFSEYCCENYAEHKELSCEMIMNYLESQTSMVSRKASALRLFSTYLVAIGKDAFIVPRNMYNSFQNQTPYIFSDEELHALFQRIDSLEADKGWIFAVAPILFRLIYTCGLRPGEGRELERANINYLTGEIQIRNTKRKKDRVVVMSEDMRKQCILFDRKRLAERIPGKYFFATPQGIPYSETTINSLFKKCWHETCEEKHVTPVPRVRVYCLRHRFATAVIHRWIDQKKDLRNKLPYLQAYMGHDRITETVYYLHLLPENLVRSSGIDWDSFDGIIPEVGP